ncbi:MAG: hypothetical protein V4498_02825 [candidate division FCPU426 bacterium]
MSNQDLFYVIRDKKTGEEIERFTGMSERGYRGLLMKVDSKRFRVDIHATKESADRHTADLKVVHETAKGGKKS